jgi:hypothetical protein
MNNVIDRILVWILITILCFFIVGIIIYLFFTTDALVTNIFYSINIIVLLYSWFDFTKVIFDKNSTMEL